MKKLLIMAAMLIPLISNSATSNCTPYVQPEVSGIITPRIATGFRKYNHYTFDTNGEMVVCENENSETTVTGSKCKKWELATSKVPKGKTFVGIKHEPKSATLQIWWR